MLSLKLTTPTHTHTKEKSYTSKITDRLTQDTNQSLLGVCFALGPLIHHNLFQALILFIRLLPEEL